MALFSRRKKNSDDPDDAGKGRADGESAAVSPDGESAPPPPVEDVPQVSISVSTYRGAGAPAASRSTPFCTVQPAASSCFAAARMLARFRSDPSDAGSA